MVHVSHFGREDSFMVHVTVMLPRLVMKAF